jgi:hypothetical protein
MQYSIFNWSAQNYDIYESQNGEAFGQRPKPRRVGGGPNSNGQQLESLLPVLPNDAVLIGKSPVAVGRIAIHHTSPAVGLGWSPEESLLVTSPWKLLGFGALGIYVAYKLLIATAKRM